LIATELQWNNPRDWTGTFGRPNRENISVSKFLQAGQRYYVEASMKQGPGGANLAVAWQKPGDPVPSNGSAPIPGDSLGYLPISSPLIITLHPQSRSAYVGESITLTAAAVGDWPLSYQWRFNGADIPGAFGRKLVLNNLSTVESGSYTMVVNNSSGSQVSQPADVTILTTVPAISAGIVNPSNGNTYFLLSQSGWAAAESTALGLGGHLVTINDQAEQNWVYETFSSFGGVARNLWIGLYDPSQSVNSPDPETRKSEFIWASGEPVSFADWNAGEPNDTFPGASFVHM
jgi:hypothetical protein